VHARRHQMLDHHTDAVAVDRSVGMEGRGDRRNNTSERHLSGPNLASGSSLYARIARLAAEIKSGDRLLFCRISAGSAKTNNSLVCELFGWLAAHWKGSSRCGV